MYYTNTCIGKGQVSIYCDTSSKTITLCSVYTVATSQIMNCNIQCVYDTNTGKY